MVCTREFCMILSDARTIGVESLDDREKCIACIGSDAGKTKPIAHKITVFGHQFSLINTSPVEGMIEDGFVLLERKYSVKKNPPVYFLFIGLVDHSVLHDLAHIPKDQRPLAMITTNGEGKVLLMPMSAISVGLFHDVGDIAIRKPDEIMRIGNYRHFELHDGASIRLCGENSAIGQLVIHDNSTTTGPLIAA